jgi:hypothetical protein
MVITPIGYLLLALSVLAVMAFCWLFASCLSRRWHRQRRGTLAAGTGTPRTPGYAMARRTRAVRPASNAGTRETAHNSQIEGTTANQTIKRVPITADSSEGKHTGGAYSRQ